MIFCKNTGNAGNTARNVDYQLDLIWNRQSPSLLINSFTTAAGGTMFNITQTVSLEHHVRLHQVRQMKTFIYTAAE